MGFCFMQTFVGYREKKVLERVANLQDKISIFFKEQKHELVDRFSEGIWIAKLLFLAASNGNWEVGAFPALNLLICVAFVQSFLNTSLQLLLSRIGMFLAKIIAKYVID